MIVSFKIWQRKHYESKHAGHVPCVVFLQRYIQVLHVLNISIVSAYSIAIYCCLTLSLNHYISLLITRFHESCVEKQSIMSNRKFQEELARHVDEPFLPHLVPELEMKKKKQKLPLPPVVGHRPFLDMKLSCDGYPKIIVRTILDCEANVPVVSQALVEIYKIPGILRSHACGIATFDGQLTKSNAGRAYTQSCTLRVGAHHMRETFEIAPLQDDHDIHLPWWWIITYPAQYVLAGKESDLKFNSPKCKNCTTKAVSEFTVEYDESVAYFGSDQECIGVQGTMCLMRIWVVR